MGTQGEVVISVVQGYLGPGFFTRDKACYLDELARSTLDDYDSDLQFCII